MSTAPSPLAPAPPRPVAAAAPVAAAPGAASILVVEDERMLAKIIGMKLGEEGFVVEHAYDGEEAYNRLAQAPLPDLILMDVLLPRLTGFDVLQRFTPEQRGAMHFIMFSNFAQQADIERAKELGAIDYIVKAAFSPAEILSKVRQVLAQTRATGTAAPASSTGSSYAQFPSMEEFTPMGEQYRTAPVAPAPTQASAALGEAPSPFVVS
jgi:DNA-binding response OmpR family regulator